MTPVLEKAQTREIISAHGGTLINRLVPADKTASVIEEAKNYPQIPIGPRLHADIEMIGIGGFSPLEGFLPSDDYQSVLSNIRLSNGLIWPIPITLDVDQTVMKKLNVGQPAALVLDGTIVAILHVEDIYQFDKKMEARYIYKTEEDQHPGVAAVYSKKDYLVGGKIDVLKTQDHKDFPQYNLTPRDTRRAFHENGWKAVVAFQTRNPIHRAHEFITKTALEIVDGLLIHPIVGATKKGDIPADVRMKCYEVLIENYYPKNRVMLAINPSNMFYAGPREAILHALVRQNYGCTHFIVGRDHAGVGGYYGTFEAQDLIKSFSREELKIEPLCFENSFYCKRTKGMATEKTSPSQKDERIFLSGTQVREM
ncbi:sulfate adenylyltransferase, partial [bacterium F11]